MSTSVTSSPTPTPVTPDNAKENETSSTTATPTPAATTEEESIVEDLAKLTVTSTTSTTSSPTKSPQEEVKAVKITLESVSQRISNGEIKKILVLTGAGISVSAGIPDFRTPGTGLYDNLSKYNLPHPTAVFEIDYFRQHPEPFYQLAKELYPSGQYRPTPTHQFIKLLDERGLLLRNFTQNIDGLELIAGLTEHKLIQAHGGFSKAACIECKRDYTEQHVKEHIFSDQIPRCTTRNCNGLIKPKIVFFGENLPEEFGTAVGTDFKAADLLIVMGTSLKVQPFASLITRVPDHVPRILINNEPAGVDEDDEEDGEVILQRNSHYMSLVAQLKVIPANHPMRPRFEGMVQQYRSKVGIGPNGKKRGFDFKSPDTRDLFIQTDCDSGVRQLAKLIDATFAHRLEELIEQDKRLKEQQQQQKSTSSSTAPPPPSSSTPNVTIAAPTSSSPTVTSSSSTATTTTTSTNSTSTSTPSSHL